MLARFYIIFCFFGALAFAAEDETNQFMELSLEELMSTEISTASKTAVSSDKAPGVVTVLTRAEIQQLGATTLSDVINMIPGFTSGAAIQGGPHRNFYVRGSFSLYSEDVLILKDGQRLNEAVTGGALNYSPDYPVDNIKQLEIIRGPGSALYGANAFVGVINIITDKTQNEGVTLRARASNEQGAYSSVRTGHQLNEETWLSLFLDYGGRSFHQIPHKDTFYLSVPLELPGFNTPHNHYQTADKTSYFQGELRLSYKALTLSYEYYHKENQNNWGLGVPADLWMDPGGEIFNLNDHQFRHKTKASQKRMGVTWSKEFNDAWSMNITGTRASYESFFSAAMVNFRFSDQYAGSGLLAEQFIDRPTTMTVGEIGLQWSKGKHSVVFGFNHQRDEIDFSPVLYNGLNAGPDHPLYNPFQDMVVDIGAYQPNGSFVEDAERKVNALFAQYTWDVNQHLSLTGGVRADDYNDFGETVNPRLAAIYAPTERLTVKALYGSAFRAPNMLESKQFLVGAIIPNSQLQPETIDTFELQATWKPKSSMVIALAAYHYQIDDTIRQLPTGNPNSALETQSVNAGTRDGEGLELEARYRNGKGLDFLFNYSYANTEDRLNGATTTVTALPENSLNAGLTLELGAFILSANASRRWSWEPQPAVSTQPPGLPSVTIWETLTFPDYTLVNFHGEYRLKGKTLTLSFDARNLTDEAQIFGDQLLFAPSGIVLQDRQFLIGFSWRSQ